MLQVFQILIPEEAQSSNWNLVSSISAHHNQESVTLIPITLLFIFIISSRFRTIVSERFVVCYFISFREENIGKGEKKFSDLGGQFLAAIIIIAVRDEYYLRFPNPKWSPCEENLSLNSSRAFSFILVALIRVMDYRDRAQYDIVVAVLYPKM